MPTLRKMIDGSSQLNTISVDKTNDVTFRPDQDVLIKRRTHRSGPITSQVIAGKILAMTDTTADVSIRKVNGITQRVTVRLDELSPVTESIKRSSVQFNPAFRRGA